ncbi:unnamed protein product [Clonostachys rhizophaga]|uniref:Inositol phoshorylceramide synthase regulatory subunit kei1 n=1 Tax=Clonostachys rhizophaga TaxID=160324 RepID=A0A9N9VND7_9HYPO|nr:unnamed protein product [Clonostachys rhizophaga]
MSRFTSLYLRVPRPKTLFGFISLQTATELISLALVFNKVTGFYGLLAILTGFQLSLLQFTTYLYSIAVLVALAFLIPHIRKQSPFECLMLAWIYILDTIINTFDTAAFGLEWYFATGASDTADNVNDIVAEGIETLKEQTALHGAAVPHETAASMVLIILLTLIRVYFCVVIMSYAQQVLQKYMQLMILEAGPDVMVDDKDGPFAAELPDGEGRRGALGRMMVSIGRGYWLDSKQHDEGWAGERVPKAGPSSYTEDV